MNTKNSWSRCANEFASLIDDLDTEFPSTGELDDSRVCPRRRRNSNDALSSRKSIVATDIALANIEQIETTELVSRWIAREICTPPISDQNPSSPSANIVSELEKSPVIKCSPKFVLRQGAGSDRKKKRHNPSSDLTTSPILGSVKFVRKKRRRFDSSSLEQRKAGEARSSTPITSKADSKPLILSENRYYLRNRKPKIEREKHQHRPQLPIISSAKFVRKKRRRFDSSLLEQRKAGEARSSTPIISQVISKPLILSENRYYLRNDEPEIGCKKHQDWLQSDSQSLAYRYFELGDSSCMNDVANCGRSSCAAIKESKTISAAETNDRVSRFSNIELNQDSFDEDQGTETPLPFGRGEKLCSISHCEERNMGRKFLFVDANCSASPSENNERVLSSVAFEAVENEKGYLCGFREVEDLREASAPLEKNTPEDLNDTQLSRDLFDEEPELANSELISCNENQLQGTLTSIQEEARPVSLHREGIDWLKTENDNEEEILGDPKPNLSPCRSGNMDRYSSEIKSEKDSHESEIASVGSTGSAIQDTEEFLPPSLGQNCAKIIAGTPYSSDLIDRSDKFLILDSEFSPEKSKFFTETERIDYDTSSENGEGDLDVDVAKISVSNGSDSDRTVSDIIEEPLTQDYVELPSKPAGLASGSLLRSISAVSPKISETISTNEPSSLDISVDTTPSSIQEPVAAISELFLSTKKKKSRPKKGSLSARLQKLVSGQVSYVRLWRYQISHNLVFQQSSTPCITLSVLRSWVQYEKNFYLSNVLDDSHGLLNDCFDNAKVEGNRERELIVMTNPEFVRAVKMPPGTAFKIHSPWKIFNPHSGKGNFILHALYIQLVSTQLEEGKNFTELRAAQDRLKNELICEYDCPCLQNGKIDDSCSVKFSNQKVNVMGVIFNEK